MLKNLFRTAKSLGKASKSMTTNTEEYRTVKEGKAVILTPKEESVFYNPIQQFNRDLSVMSIRAWSEIYEQTKKGKKEVEHKRRKLDSESEEKAYIRILEALSATGLRAIRYGHEIPHVSKIVANDLLGEAVKSIDRNILHNKLGSKVSSNLGDAVKFMSSTNEKFHVIDLDPYGTAAPFIDSAIQAIKDEGLLLITCTDAGVLAGSGYPEKCFALYGGNNFGNSYVTTEANHEAGIRLMLNTIANIAARYKKSIEPLLSLSIDYYFRVFVRVRTSPLEVKELASKTMLSYYCNGCGDIKIQHMGRVIQNENKPKKFQVPRVVDISSECKICESQYNLAGPFWAGELHNDEFIDTILNINESSDSLIYGTKQRIQGMLTLAKSELSNPFYFNLNMLTSLFKTPPIPIDEFSRAVGNAGYEVSLTHAKKNSVKTNAPWIFVLQLMKEWLAQSNKKLLAEYEKKVSESKDVEKLRPRIEYFKNEIYGNPNLTSGMVGYKILKNLPPTLKTIDFETINSTSKRMNKLRHLKMVRYQENPTKNWGPKAKPK